MSQNGLNANRVAAESPEILVSPCAKLPTSISDCNAYLQAGAPMAYFVGDWEVEIENAPSHMDHLPKDHSIIEVIEKEAEGLYDLTFTPQNPELQPLTLSIPKGDDPKRLDLTLQPGKLGYSLHARFVLTSGSSSEDGYRRFVCTIRYGLRGHEDNEIATYTATKIEHSERTA